LNNGKLSDRQGKKTSQGLFKATTLTIILLLTISCILLVSCSDNANDHVVLTEKQVTSSPTPTLPVVPLNTGWTSINQFSGRGSVEYTDININVSKLWGALFSCRGTGKATITLIPEKFGGSFSADCSSTSTGMNYTETADYTNVIRQIKIVTDASSRWQLQIQDCTSDEHNVWY
jgi:hypothetical protein